MRGDGAGRVIEQYLTGYAEPEARGLLAAQSELPAAAYEQTLVLPAYRESAASLSQLRALLEQNSTLLVLVINQPEHEPNPHPANRALLAAAGSMGPLLWSRGRFALHQITDTPSAVLVVDRFCSEPIPTREGVGLARKIGTDLSLACIHLGMVRSHWIHCTDADCALHQDHFAPSQAQGPAAAALVFPFEHLCGDDPVGRATRVWDLRLRHYVAGLRRAGSLYAFPTLGSALAVQAPAYAQVRGFPKRSGGEDFYLLNKLAKVAPVVDLAQSNVPGQPMVRIRARLSDRVPFGTGPSVRALLDHPEPETVPVFEHPQVFVELGMCLNALPRLEGVELGALGLGDSASRALEHLGVGAAIQHARANSRGPVTFTRHLHNWFDALKTLRWLHLMREAGYPNQSLQQLQRSAAALAG
ncbi:MAG: hypothetical protein SV583_11220 [Pseudomonadota bacterium]|nr:hypothetical protein [Pseudomonadota bacterium]